MIGGLAAVRGALGFLTRLPVGHRDGDWAAFRSSPAAFPVVGYVAGALAALPLLATEALPAATVALGYLLAVYAVLGIHHLDGVADLGDALVVHGDRERRREVLKDTTTGVGALLAVSLVVVALALGGLSLAGLPPRRAIGVAVAAEVGTKLGMAAMACFGTASDDGMGRQFTTASDPLSFVAPALIALPAAALTWPNPAAAVALGGALAGIGLPWNWATGHLGGVNGDIFGAANEIGRVAGVHLGVIAWTLS
ncbi:adenosylcobinamide-GDP ribazoletransferase [Haloterrigena sp. SYSU A558-1]|uniref:Adenosylcobinamide-GDP ribazoletransferase n=1 Tax=Haloterrigena gelatinilytica TaxID=2741724 RepID=A0ABX2LBP0_9EURY|nr:adenosylcobinamide-GDP ribazoletransferase [Haloterrigena gelatinilytica]NUC70982.1 adenosylcobinamide-GDP ribazoletransferase [Haloterrigena gelatinilytica]